MIVQRWQADWVDRDAIECRLVRIQPTSLKVLGKIATGCANNAHLALAINIPPVTSLYDFDHQFVVVNLINDPIVADADAVFIFVNQLRAATRARFLGQLANANSNPILN